MAPDSLRVFKVENKAVQFRENAENDFSAVSECTPFYSLNNGASAPISQGHLGIQHSIDE